MTWQEAIPVAQHLMKKWIGAGPVDLKRIQASIKQDIAFTMKNPARMTAGCLTDCRNDRKLVGQLLAHHSELFAHRD